MADDLEQRVARGQQATDLLDNELFMEAWEKVEAGIIQRWRDCSVKDRDSQHELKLMLLVLNEVRRHIQTVAETGKMASLQLNSDSKVKKFTHMVRRAF